MNLVIICFGIFIVFCAVFLLVIVFTPIWYLYLLILCVICCSCFLELSLFYGLTNKILNRERERLIKFEHKKAIVEENVCKKIVFTRCGNKWQCKNDDYLFEIDLSGYLLQKSFLRAMVVRNLRYNLISKKLPFRNLFITKFQIKKIENLQLVFIEKSKQTTQIVVEDYVSKYNITSWAITYSKYYSFSNRTNGYFISVRYTDERSYLSSRSLKK